ncbi:hypothetical protein ACEPAI_1319 [Sanghuangporus weigelae]
MRTIKLVIIGDSGVGKTSLRNQYITGKFSTGYRATIGTDFITKTLPHYQNSDESVTLQIWDTAGQERFSSLSTAFFRGADAALLMFDVNRPETLHALAKWWETFKTYAPVPDEEAEEFCCVVVGNKVDLVETGEANGSATEAASDIRSEGVGKRVTEAEAERFLEDLIPRTSRDEFGDDHYMSASDEGEANDPFLSDVNPDHSRQSTGHFMRRAISGFSLHSVTSSSSHRKSDSKPEEDEDVGDRIKLDRKVHSPPRMRSQSISIQPSNGHIHPFRHFQKSRSSEAASSMLGGTMTSARTTQTIYHTPSSSIFDHFESAPSSPFHGEHDLSAPSSPSSSLIAGKPSTPFNNSRRARRMTSASVSSSSSVPTVTPSLFLRSQASHSAVPTPPTPIEPSASSSFLPALHVDSNTDASKHLLSHRKKHEQRLPLPPRPERGPKLFLTSAKTGEGVGPAFEHIARRVCMSWAYSEALEALGINREHGNEQAPDPTGSDTFRLRLGLFNGSAESRSVWLRERMNLQGGARCCGS